MLSTDIPGKRERGREDDLKQDGETCANET